MTAQLILMQGIEPAETSIDQPAYELTIPAGETDLFELLANSICPPKPGELPLSALAAWVRELTEPTRIRILGYERVTSVRTDLRFGWLLTQSEQLHAEVVGTHFVALDGPAVVTRVPTEKIMTDGESAEHLIRDPADARLLGALHITGGMNEETYVKTLDLPSKELERRLAQLRARGIVRQLFPQLTLEQCAAARARYRYAGLGSAPARLLCGPRVASSRPADGVRSVVKGSDGSTDPRTR